MLLKERRGNGPLSLVAERGDGHPKNYIDLQMEKDREIEKGSLVFCRISRP